ncbi:uncharacterized protein LOC130742100 [Lotus japonicus]|uniref:uncharacterized protein LOC130742100 n=1 Tax=Lotus japonicus TaxID=34305 RepID=UPI002588E2D9|nr:uncharacterized protein LOC130742100 [Lotus japonicus]
MNLRIQRLWAREGDVKVMDLSEEYFLVRFSSENDYKFALYEGPWMIADHYLMVQRWRPMFRAGENEVKKIAVWIRLPDLPVELFNDTFLWRLGSILGTMLKIDSHTSIHTRGRFARICVELDLSQQLTPTFTAMGEEHRLEYEGLHFICFRCGRYGHKIEGCREPTASVQMSPTLHMSMGASDPPKEIPVDTVVQDVDTGVAMEAEDQQAAVTKETEPPNCFGPWMLVKKTVRKRTGKSNGSNLQNQRAGSRFNVLEDITEKKQDLFEEVTPTSKVSHPPRQAKTAPAQTKKNGKNQPKQGSSKTPGPTKTPKENIIPQPKTPLDSKVPSPSMVLKERALMEEVSRHQHRLWEDFKAGKGTNDWLESSAIVPTEEDLQFIQAMLRKKGVEKVNPGDKCLELVNQTPQCSLQQAGNALLEQDAPMGDAPDSSS